MSKSKLQELPLQLSTLGLIGFLGSLSSGYEKKSLSGSIIVNSILWQIALALIVTMIVIWFLKSTEAKFIKKKYSVP